MQNRTILLTAYAVNPYKGSEDGMGWNMIYEIAKHNKVIAITRENNESAINKYCKENNISHLDNVEFAYFDLPYALRFWKKKSRGALLYFYLWQISILFFIYKKKWKFDIAHNLNFHNDWTASFLWLLGKPFVWGPIGHHPQIPKDYILTFYGKKAYYKNKLNWLAKNCFWKLDPFLKICKYKANKIIAMNSSVTKVLGISKNKISIISSVGTEVVEKQHITSEKFNILSVGRFVPLKGFDVTIRAFADFFHQQNETTQQKLQLTLIGKGESEAKLKALVAELEVEAAVNFINWIPRHELAAHFSQADIFFFPSHEGAGMVVAEALSYGVPVLCFDNIGPGEFVNENCGLKVPYTNYEQSVETFATYLNFLFDNDDLRQKLSKGAKKHFDEKFDWKQKGLKINEIYNSILSHKEVEKIIIETVN